MVSHFVVAIRFAQGWVSCRGSRMFIEGNAVYSYGYHFPIAFRLKNNKVLFNTDRYSKSTNQHQSYVRRALSNCEIIECDTNEIKNAIANPESPLIITKTREYNSINGIFRDIKKILNEKGIKRVPIKKWETMINDWVLIKQI